VTTKTTPRRYEDHEGSTKGSSRLRVSTEEDRRRSIMMNFVIPFAASWFLVPGAIDEPVRKEAADRDGQLRRLSQ